MLPLPVTVRLGFTLIFFHVDAGRAFA